MDHPGRPEGCQRRVSALNYDAESETLSRAGSMLSEITTANGSVAGDTEFAGIGEFVAELKEMAQVQYQKQRGDQVRNWKCFCAHADSTYLTISTSITFRTQLLSYSFN